MTLMRVGETVYDEKKQVVARFVHGAWYHERKRKATVEFEPIEPEQAKGFDLLPDVSSLEMSHGELGIVDVIRRMLSVRGISSQLKSLVTEAVYQGVATGLRRYGPYDPGKETRDLVGMAQGKVRNAIVYCAMSWMRRSSGADWGAFAQAGELQDIMLELSKLWLRLEQLQGRGEG